MALERRRRTVQVTDENSWEEFSEMANDEGFGNGRKTNTYWDFVRVLLDFYKRNQAIDNVFDRIEFKIRDIKAISPVTIDKIVRKVIEEMIPVLVRASVREELEMFDQEAGGEI